MDSPEYLPPPTAIQNYHDEDPKSKPCATTTNHFNNSNEKIALVNKVTASTPTKNNPQKQIYILVTLKNMKNNNVNINTDPDNSTVNDKNTVYNHCIEHVTSS